MTMATAILSKETRIRTIRTTKDRLITTNMEVMPIRVITKPVVTDIMTSRMYSKPRRLRKAC